MRLTLKEKKKEKKKRIVAIKSSGTSRKFSE